MNKTNALCRRLLTVLALVVAMVLPAQVWAGITPVKPSAGDGSSGNPYQIGNAAELYWFAALVNGTLTDGTAQNSNACAILTSNITVNTGVLKADGLTDAGGNPEIIRAGKVTVPATSALILMR